MPNAELWISDVRHAGAQLEVRDLKPLLKEVVDGRSAVRAALGFSVARQTRPILDGISDLRPDRAIEVDLLLRDGVDPPHSPWLESRS
jgi:hypothetical protein